MLHRSIPDHHTRPAARIVGTGDRAVALRDGGAHAIARPGFVSASACDRTQHLNYDRLDRLQEVRDSNLALIEAYTYDATGNRLSQQLGTQAATSYSYPATSHRLSAVGAAARGYDAVGNTLTGVPGYEADSASYDARNRLVQVGSPSAQLLANYNGRGERVLASQGTPAPALPTTSAAWTTSAGVRGYVYDESGQVLSTLIAGNPLGYEEIVWIDNIPVGRVLSSTSAVLEVHAIHSDHLNTPRALANAQAQGGQAAGTVVWRWKLNSASATGSNAFGAQPADENPDGNGTSLRFDLRFPGQQWDAAVGVSYNYFRDYEPGTGRYVESDPVGLDGGVSTYNYGLGNPSVSIDPLGLFNVTAVEIWNGGAYEWLYEFTFSSCFATGTLWIAEQTAGNVGRGARALSRALDWTNPPEPAGDVDVSGYAKRCECLDYDDRLEEVFSAVGTPGERVDAATAARGLDVMKRELDKIKKKECKGCSSSDYYDWNSILQNARDRGTPSIRRIAQGG